MICLINNLRIVHSDATILAASAVLFGVVGGFIAWLSSKYWFRRWSARSAQEDKLADTAHTRLLGFSAFVLALAMTNVFSNLAKTEAAVWMEGMDIRRWFPAQQRRHYQRRRDRLVPG